MFERLDMYPHQHNISKKFLYLSNNPPILIMPAVSGRILTQNLGIVVAL
jgi:hypothetical protein